MKNNEKLITKEDNTHKKPLALFLSMALLPIMGWQGRTSPTAPSAQPAEPEETTEPTVQTEPPETTVATESAETTATNADLYIDGETAKKLPSGEELTATQFEAWRGAAWLDPD